MLWFILFYLMFGVGIGLGLKAASVKSINVEIDGLVVFTAFFWPVAIGIYVGEKING